MKVFLNVSNLHVAGGLSVGIGIVEALLNNPSSAEYIVYIPDKKLYNFEDTEKIHFVVKPTILKGPLGIVLSIWMENRLIRQMKVDKVFTVGNIPMITRLPQLLMIQWAYLVYPDSIVWSLMSFKEKIIRKLKIYLIKDRLSYVTAVTVQTEVMKSRFKKYINNTMPVHVVTSAFAPIYKKSSLIKLEQIDDKQIWKILCLTRYYSHKNLEVLIDVARLAKLSNYHSFKFVLTLDMTSGQVQGFFRKIKTHDVTEYFENIGAVSFDQLADCYSQVDAFILPSLLETIGLTFYEAMHFNKLVFAPDLDFAREVCKDSAIFFDPLDAADIYRKIKEYRNDDAIELRLQKIKKGKMIVAQNGNWDTIVARYEKILENL